MFRLAILVGIFSVISAGFKGVWIKQLTDLTSFQLLLSCFLCGFLFLVSIYPLVPNRWKKGSWLSKELYIFPSLVLVYFSLTTIGLRYNSLAEIMLLSATAPFFALILDIILYKKRPSIQESLGASICFFGIFFIYLGQAQTQDFSNLFGNSLAILCGVQTAVYTLLYRKFDEQGRAPHPYGVGVMTFAFGSIFFFILWFLNQETTDVALSFTQIIQLHGPRLLLIGAVTMAIPSVCFAFVAKTLSPALASSFTLLNPIVAGILGYIFLQERLGSEVFLGGFLILLGMTLLSYTLKWKRSEKKACCASKPSP